MSPGKPWSTRARIRSDPFRTPPRESRFSSTVTMEQCEVMEGSCGTMLSTVSCSSKSKAESHCFATARIFAMIDLRIKPESSTTYTRTRLLSRNGDCRTTYSSSDSDDSAARSTAKKSGALAALLLVVVHSLHRGADERNDDDDDAWYFCLERDAACRGGKKRRTLLTMCEAVRLPYLENTSVGTLGISREEWPLDAPGDLMSRQYARWSMCLLIIAELERRMPPVDALIANFTNVCAAAAQCRRAP
mmetsp:Transcript_19266/g.59445  ORF Transcript_19266/g.59445 Transcript_19266/m.59445 type:complete len:247 (-) Transcript_19266:11-751(-)